MNFFRWLASLFNPPRRAERRHRWYRPALDDTPAARDLRRVLKDRERAYREYCAVADDEKQKGPYR